VVPLSHLVDELVVAQLIFLCAGTASTETRGDLSFSTRKPYRQKGTGRARAGSRRSPLWRHGGVVFGPHPRDFSQRPPAKVRRAALKVVLTAKLRDRRLMVLEGLELAEAKTRLMAAAMRGLGLGKALVVTPAADEALERSARNLPDCRVLRVAGLNCYDLLRHTHVVILKDSLPGIEARLMK
jgi:large subunit ribosomal protein L4